MNILFIFPRPTPYNSQSVRELPSGGTEKAVIFLGEAFKKLGHTVEWLTTADQLREYQGNPDVVITQVAELLEGFPNARKIWWVHHFSDQPVIQQNAAFGRCFADQVVTLSRAQHDDFTKNLRIESAIIGHGVWLDEVYTPTWDDSHTFDQPKDPYRLIYASTPFRGLDRVAELFPRIKAAEPRATIGIASSMATYGDKDGDKQYKRLFKRLESIPGVELLGSLNQQQLYSEFAKASVFFYPCTWPETYCLVMDEAIAHGCTPFTTGLGALNERWEGFPDMSSLSTAVRAVIGKLNTNPPEHWYKPKDWLDIAKQWEREVLGV